MNKPMRTIFLLAVSAIAAFTVAIGVGVAVAEANTPTFCCKPIAGGWECVPTNDPLVECEHGTDLICSY